MKYNKFLIRTLKETYSSDLNLNDEYNVKILDYAIDEACSELNWMLNNGYEICHNDISVVISIVDSSKTVERLYKILFHKLNREKYIVVDNDYDKIIAVLVLIRLNRHKSFHLDYKRLINELYKIIDS